MVCVVAIIRLDNFAAAQNYSECCTFARFTTYRAHSFTLSLTFRVQMCIVLVAWSCELRFINTENMLCYSILLNIELKCVRICRNVSHLLT